MLTKILAVIVLLVAVGAIFMMIVCGIDTALRETYKKHAMRYAREQYRKWCAESPVEVESRLVIICGKGYKEGGQR